MPLMTRTIENGFELTGPISRGDWAVVEAHLARAARRAPGARADVPRARGGDGAVRITRTIAETRAALRDAGEVGLVPTMGAYHAGPRRPVRRRAGGERAGRRQPVRQPGAVRRPARSRPLPARRGVPTPRSRKRRASTCSSRRPSRRCTRRVRDLGGRRARLARARGRPPPAPLPRGRDRLPEALQHRPAAPRVLRPEGRAAGRGRPPDDPRPRSRPRAPGHPHRPRPRRARALLAERAPLAGGARARARPPARAGDA